MQDNFNKLKLEAEASNNAIVSNLQELLRSIESLGKEVETMKVALKTTDDRISSLDSKAQGMNSELTQLKQEHQNLKQETEAKQSEVAAIDLKLQEKQHAKNSLESAIVNEETKLRDITTAVAKLESEISDIKNNLLNAEEIREEKVGVIEKEVVSYQEKIETKSNQYKIIKHLLDTGYASDSHFEVIKVLKQPGLSTVDQLTMSSGVGRAAVEETLKSLAEKGVVSLEGDKLTVVKDFRI